MNDISQSIGWAKWSWNALSGCLGPMGTPASPRRCNYCYARKLANGRLKPLYLANHNVLEGCMPLDPFAPRFWPERLAEPAKVKKPSGIFVGSMTELFHPAIPDEWREAVANAEENAPWHTYIHLTKRPDNLPLEFGQAWIGITAEDQWYFEERWPHLALRQAAVRFVSMEPLFGTLPRRVLEKYPPRPDWFILGGLTGRRQEWTDKGLRLLRGFILLLKEMEIPVFVKDSLEPHMRALGLPMLREFPDA